jgi:tetratricopeptide (TPR) repeat protein
MASSPTGPAVGTGLAVFAGIALAGVAAALLFFRSIAGFALFWFVAGLTWTVFSFSAADPFSERGLYFPLCGIVMAIPWLVEKASARRVTQIAAAVAASVLLIAAGTGTFLRNRDWQDSQSLWQDAAAKTPSSPLPYEQLGALYYDRGILARQEAAGFAQQGQGPAAASSQEAAQQFFAAAEESFATALALDPANPDTIYRLGRCAGLLGRGDESVERIQEALRLDPGNFEYTIQLALNLMGRANSTGAMNDRLRSIDYFRRAAELGQLPPEVRTQFAGQLAMIGELEAAQRELTAITAAADYPPAAQQLEQVRRTMDLLTQLDQRAQMLLASDATSQEGLRLQAEALMGRGKLLQASYLLDRLLSRHPDDADSWILMGVARAIVNDEQGFLSQWPNAPVATAGDPSVWVQLARRCAATGRWDSARIYLESAAGRSPDVALPLVNLAEIAMSMDALSVATGLLDEATKRYIDSPKAWLLLCDIAVASDNLPAARRYLAEAEKRGAAPGDMEARRAQVGAGPAEEAQDDFTTILR